ncbi:TPA: hypothetical protein ACGY8F_002265 [Stenotrophomonas maltophilia]
MSNENKTLADAQPARKVRPGDQAERARFEAFLSGNPLIALCAGTAWQVWQAAISGQTSMTALYQHDDGRYALAMGEAAQRRLTDGNPAWHRVPLDVVERDSQPPAGHGCALDEVACDLPSLFGRASLEGHEVGQKLAKEVQAKMRSALSAQPSPGGQGDALLESLVARWRNHAEEIGVSDNLLCQKIANCTMRHAAELQAALAARQPVADQHPDDLAVDAFATAMKAKMADARAKGRGGWEDPAQCTADDLSRMLRDHVDKGDPRDVANFCMMLHQRGEAIAARQPVGWQPMESAPKDGTVVLGLLEGSDIPQSIRFRDGWEIAWDGHRITAHDGPLRWAPLYAATPARQSTQVYLDGLDRALGEAIDQRDRYHEVADELADHIASITGVGIGEHSSANCPWQNAIEAAEEYKAAQALDLGPRPMNTAPRDGTMVRLLVLFDDHATEDKNGPAWTIGANTFQANGENLWQFAGWCWTHDHFTEGKGTPVGWLPLTGAAQAVGLAPTMIPDTPEVRDILGRPNFWCSPWANILRRRGDVIPCKAEEEQAAVIRFMLNHYLAHGAAWAEAAEAELQAIRYQVTRND